MNALHVLSAGMPREIKWAVDGSTSLVLQGYAILPDDIDLLTDAEGAYHVEKAFSDHVVRKVEFSSTEKFESHFGVIKIDGVSIDIMGNLRVFRNGAWSPVQNPGTVKTETIFLDGLEIPVVSVEHQVSTGYLDERLKRGSRRK